MATTSYVPPTTLNGLKDYVSGSSTMQQTAESTVQLFVTHCHLKAQFPEIRLDKHVRAVAMISVTLIFDHEALLCCPQHWNMPHPCIPTSMHADDH